MDLEEQRIQKHRQEIGTVVEEQISLTKYM